MSADQGFCVEHPSFFKCQKRPTLEAKETIEAKETYYRGKTDHTFISATKVSASSPRSSKPLIT